MVFLQISVVLAVIVCCATVKSLKMEIKSDLSAFNNVHPVTKSKLTLKDAELWKKFHDLETEMIITKSGRRMFPSLQVQASEMDPNALYCVFLEMVPASRCRYKYSSAGGWTPAGSEETQSHHRLYLHPESPAKGEFWMSQPINFSRMKLTNMPAPPAGQIVLSSMHKYQPRIIIAQTSDPRTLAWSPSTFVSFPETQFIAVTAYQNEKITQLKIDNNPFAKGFRQNGQAKCKRKKIEEEKEEEFICVTDEDCEDGNTESRSRTSSISERLSPEVRDNVTVKKARIEENYPCYPCYSYYPAYTGYYPSYESFYSYNTHKPREVKPAKKLTDFSIRAILGC